MNKLQAVKFVARLVVGSGTASIANSIIRNNVQPGNLIENLGVAAATVVIGSMASEATRAHTDRQIDAVVEMWQTASTSEETPTPTEA